MKTTQEILQKAKNAKMQLSVMAKEVKNKVLIKIAENIIKHKDKILEANKIDLENAKNVLSTVMLDRLRLDENRIKAMSDGVLDVVLLEDPVGKILEKNTLKNDIEIKKISVPIGVVGIIYESRPNVTLDAGVLCFKSGNVCVLRGGKEAFNTSFQIVKIMRDTLKEMSLNEDYICFIEDTSRQSAYELMTAVGFIDALIPRGGAGLIKACVENAKVPCIQTGTGICHIYIDEFADFNKALNIIENAKTSRPSVCNACEVCLVNFKIAEQFLPLLKNKLTTERKNKTLQIVEFRCDKKSFDIIGGTLAGENDFDTEFLDYVLAIKVVDNVEEAIEHISQHSTQHSDCIISENKLNCEIFTKCVDSAAVYVNASTRFTDGGEFGKGCEIGISTQKLHARGPMGLQELCTYKYILNGNGQIR
ncbi:MAG: glutamate-5-semialdehyde dehydrogenase [Clostridia bacterium]|nr:glutamate-5-semialdehyde dehydrogenase [Clostridia bacterium]